MAELDTPIHRFFKTYERSSDESDIPAIVNLFAEVFMAAGPQGAQPVNAADSALALPRRVQLFRNCGCTSTSLVSLDETRLDGRFVMVETRWRMTFRREQHDQVEVLADSLFVVDTKGESLKIIFYLAHQDHMALLRNHGLLPVASTP